MAITFDAATGNKVGSGTTNTWSHTTGAGSNRILIVAVDTGLTITSVTYGGVALTQLGIEDYNGNTEHLSLWYLLAPVSGAASVVATASGTTFIIAASASYAGVAQSSTFGTLAKNNGVGTASTNAVSTTSSNQTVVDTVNNGAASAVTQTAGQTLRIQPVSSGVGLGDIAATGASMTLSWSFTNSIWAQVSVAMNPALAASLARVMSDGFGGMFS